MLLIVSALLALVSCDSPRYTADQVIVIAQNYSPEKCSTGGHLDLHSLKWVGASYYDPSWEAEYAGNSIWEIRKKCQQRVVSTFYFDEKTTMIR